MSPSLFHAVWKCRSLTAPSWALQRSASSTSSNTWLSRQSRDPFVRQRNIDSFRSRGAYKLHEINQKYRFLQRTKVVVDIGAAPGGWSEFISHSWRDRLKADFSNESSILVDNGERTQQRPIILAVDLLPIEPIHGVTTVKGNFLSKEVYDRLQRHLRGREVDVVLSDMCENTSGNRDRDIANSLELCNAALIFAQREFVKCVPQGPFRGVARKTLVMKFFADPEFDVFRRTCQDFFNRVDVFKPKSSRSDSSENYLICTGYRDAGEPSEENCPMQHKPEAVHV